MNKRFHRVVFNAARGLRVVVQETARRAGGAQIVVALLAAAPSSAQIVGAPNVPGHLRPTVLVAPNGVPLINIQTPCAAGVSRNLFNQFDVQRGGAILNNSRTDVQTQLGGFVQGNPYLATGPAHIILNEVVSGNTQGTEQGIEGQNIAISTGTLTNTSGAIRADVNTTITSGGTIAAGNTVTLEFIWSGNAACGLAVTDATAPDAPVPVLPAEVIEDCLAPG
ncbi:Extended Signal Peptide of Type V secretion system [Variovorax sp. CF079]|uniref:two-partner secretion domain-containing protein n=1 Tax=Variovorax sp. CF079 TaxID=1882774 RepID=UPI000882C861|nr:ESPR-type extended signal peptide-containing protein [Variovorax sp. CF079]SDD20884.1 Extended Signal Peptide of Type V secretion system [Variovorax sp. CF079]